MIPNVHIVNLCHNKITEVEGFAKTTDLREVNLSYNQITRVSSFAFENCKFLAHLNFSFN